MARIAALRLGSLPAAERYWRCRGVPGVLDLSHLLLASAPSVLASSQIAGLLLPPWALTN